MAWARLDDRWHDHPKVVEAGLEAAGLWVMCLTWAHANRRKSPVPGFIPTGVLGRFAGAKAAKLSKALVKVGLLDTAEGGWLVHDFTDYLPKHDPNQAAAAGRAGAQRRWAKTRDGHDDVPPPDSEPPYDSDSEPPYGTPSDPVASASRPDGTRASARRNPVPVPKPTTGPVGGGATDSTAHEHAAAALAPLRTALEAVQLIVRWDKLEDEQAARIGQLVDIHGVPRLVAAAQRAWQRNNPPAFAQAWIGAWGDLPAPRALRAVDSKCAEHGTPSPCISCAADRKIADAAAGRRAAVDAFGSAFGGVPS